MKKMLILCCLILFLASMALLGCATAPPGPPKPGVPRISNLVVPKTVTLGVSFPISFQFEDSEADIKTVTYEWSWGPGGFESHTYDARIFGKDTGIFVGKLFPGKLPDIFYLAVYVTDAKGNRSNTLRTSIFTK